MKLAASFSRGRRDDAATVRAMLAAQDVDGTGVAEAVEVQGGAVGWLPTADRFAPFPLVGRGARGNVLIVSGTPVHCRGSLPALLERAVEQDLEAATRSLAELDGGFAALFWDATQRKLALVTDYLGMQPLFIAQPGGAFLAATEQKGVVASGLVEDTPDAAGWGAFFSFGHYLGRHTSLAGVKWAEAGAITVYDPATGHCTARRYWEWPQPAPVRTLDEVDTDAIYAALVESVRGYGQYGLDGVLLMSGGFDSRLVLCLTKEAGMSPKALIVRHQEEHDDADGRYAVEAVRRLGVEYEVHAPARDFYASDAYRRYLQLSELGNPSLGLFIARVSGAVRSAHRAVWEGLAPNAMQRSDRNPEHGGFDAYLPRAYKPKTSTAWKAVSRVFAPEWVDEMYERFQDVLREEVARYRDDEFGVFEFSVRNRTRNRLGANPFKVFGNDALAFTPGVTRAFYERVYELSGAVRGLTALRLRLFREHFPEALTVPFCSGGKLLPSGSGFDAGLRWATVRSTALKNWYVRRSLERLGLYHPFDFDLETVQRELLADVDAGDPRLNGDAVRALLRGTPATPLDAMARERLFYWHVKQLVLRRPHAVRGPASAARPTSPRVTAAVT
jgi:hypothetical protein